MTHEKLTMAQALNRALRDAMAEDPTVLMFGEDVQRQVVAPGQGRR